MTLKSFVQKFGMAISSLVFHDRFLSTTFGKRMYLFCYGAFKHAFESSELKKISVHIRPASTVLDIGANVGLTTAFFRQRVGPAGHVLAFEPDPLIGSLFRFHMDRLQADQVHFFPVAIGDHIGELPFFENTANRADNRMVADPDEAGHTRMISVPVKTISWMATQQPDLFRDVSFIKIDVQGYETRVLRGMESWLSTAASKPVIHCELWPYGLDRAGSSVDELFAVCERLGYVVSASQRAEAKQLAGTKAYSDLTLFPQKR